MSQPTRPELLGLPAELRNHIYELVLSDHKGFKQPAIMRACKQTREGLELFYSTHCFDFSDIKLGRRRNYWGLLHLLLDAVGNANASHIRNVRFHMAATDWGYCDDGSREFGVTPVRLEVRVCQRDVGGWEAVGRWCSKDCAEMEFGDLGFGKLSAEAAMAGSSMKGGEEPATMMWRLVAEEVYMLPTPVLKPVKGQVTA